MVGSCRWLPFLRTLPKSASLPAAHLAGQLSLLYVLCMLLWPLPCQNLAQTLGLAPRLEFQARSSLLCHDRWGRCKHHCIHSPSHLQQSQQHWHSARSIRTPSTRWLACELAVGRVVATIAAAAAKRAVCVRCLVDGQHSPRLT